VSCSPDFHVGNGKEDVMGKSLALLPMMAFAFCAAPLMAGVTLPSGLAPGDQYLMAFVTHDATTAQSTNIGDYNTFVSDQAALNPSLPSASWVAIGSTETTSAESNISSILTTAAMMSLPVYNTNGQEVVPHAADLFINSFTPDPILQNPIEYTQSGDLQDTNVWTGTDFTGASLGNGWLGNPFGNGDIGQGLSANTDFQWIQGPPAPVFNEGFYLNASLYALSSPITVGAQGAVPEPAMFTIWIIGIAVAAFSVCRRLRT
jgi:hypothetical protein